MMRRCDKSLQNLILSKKKIIHEKVKCMTFFMELKCIFSKRQFLQFSLSALALFDVEPITLDDTTKYLNLITLYLIRTKGTFLIHENV